MGTRNARKERRMIYEYDAFIEVLEELDKDKMVELDCAIANFIEDKFGFSVEFSIVSQVDEKSGDCEIEKVIRCRDCKQFRKKGEDYGCCLEGYGNVDGNHYCSYGERKEDDEA